MKTGVRVLVVDDSALMRKLIPQIIEKDSSIHVVGTAMDGNFALRKIRELQPDVVTLDLEMPGLNGIETLKRIRREFPALSVLVVSSHSTASASITLKALGAGAFDFVAKPVDVTSRMPEIAAELIEKIKVAAASPGIKPIPLNSHKVSKPPASSALQPTKIIAIGVSTGGPQALQYVLSHLPANFPGSIVIVQHMPEGFTATYARRLEESCSIHVKEAQSGDLLIAGRALVCPGNRHIRVKRLPLGNVVVLGDDERVNGHRPSVDVLFRSLAEEFGLLGIAVLMTGMGEDGAEAMREVKAQGGLTMAQSEESCVVFGMPKAAIDRGHVLRIVSLENLARALQSQCVGERNAIGAGSGSA